MTLSDLYPPRRGGTMKEESGFTLVELLAVVTLLAILMTISAWALRGFWFTQGLSGSQNEVMTQLRAMQQESRTAAPKVFGARFAVGSSDWQLINYDADLGTCAVVGNRTFEAGVVVESMDFDSEVMGADRPGCLPAPYDDLVLFYARGSAIPGTITLDQPVVDKQARVCVSGLTGRVTRC